LQFATTKSNINNRTYSGKLIFFYVCPRGKNSFSHLVFKLENHQCHG